MLDFDQLVTTANAGVGFAIWAVTQYVGGFLDAQSQYLKRAKPVLPVLVGSVFGAAGFADSGSLGHRVLAGGLLGIIVAHVHNTFRTATTPTSVQAADKPTSADSPD
jgi:hypothetical protein